jgi:hypothetical protein
VLFRLGRLRGPRAPGLNLIIPVVDVLRWMSLRIVTLPIQSQGIITREGESLAAASPPPLTAANGPAATGDRARCSRLSPFM